MRTAPGDAAAAADGFARDWRAVRIDADIQFAPVTIPPPEPVPAWITWLNELLASLLGPVGRWLGQAGPAIPWLAAALGIGLLALIAWRMRDPITQWLGRKPRVAEATDAWQPDAGVALALLEDADRLADAGRFDEATRLLLQRSIGQIVAARPGLLEPATTAREIAALPALPMPARQAFAVIATRVERSLFALQQLSAADWQAARAAYADFALSPVPA